MIIAIDGPAGAGKSTVARRLAARLDAAFLDTGAMYRAVTLACIRGDVDPGDGEGCAGVARRLDLTFEPGGDLLVDGALAGAAIRSREVTQQVSQVSAHPGVRETIVADQRALAEALGDVVAEGRDTTTVVFPAAELKVYLDASPEVRARRRAEQLDQVVNVEAIEAEIRARDAYDSGRDHSPLRHGEDAVHVPTDGREIDEVVDHILSLIRERRA